jgi:hypothetical protein
MTTESIVAFLGSMENTVKACKEASCLAELGRMVSADYVAQGNIGRFGNDLTIKVELYNVKSGNLMDSFTGYSKDIYGLLALIDEKAPDLFKNMADVSSIKKTAQPPTVAVQTPATVDTSQPKRPQNPNLVPKYVVKPTIIYNGNNISIQEYVQKLIEKDLKKNKEEIQKLSFHLSPSDKIALYEKNQTYLSDPLGYAVLNVLPGFGLGSYTQGDITSGIILSVADVVGWGLAYTAFVMTYDYDIGGYVEAAVSYWIVRCIAGSIAPIVHQSGYNKTLKETLNINDNISYSIDPLIIPKDGPPAVGLALNLRY